MKDLSYERERPLSREEAADRLSALADALRAGGEAELELGGGVLSLRIPDELRGEIELSVEDGEIELEVELTWPLGGAAKSPGKSEGTKGKGAAAGKAASPAAKPRKTSAKRA
ncbi:amphi-Trp domain-containing protein [Streptomyces sp. CC208A]|uniref:amphi-Trp domain-containing protein n=1 Tax=Streptomyces sp. CC208A TaxID=3044573 RepID=UPI0024A7F416|nr:amphi-Trp domain-containing protein [Streptomyces sp. CC208A]